jgi:aryl-alcohol dehydrogenase-like predicted oxidoreductase
VTVCEGEGLASVVRGPLAQGILTGKFTPESTLPRDDVRHSWDFREGEQAKRLDALGAMREVLTAEKRTLAQGALGWLWARSGAMIPIPGFKTVAQVEENAAAMWFGALSPDQMDEIGELMTEVYGQGAYGQPT